MEKEKEEVDTKAEEFDDAGVEVEILEETVTMEVLPNIRDCVVT